MFAKISNNAVVAYPVSPHMEHPHISLPANWLGGDVEGDHYVTVFAPAPPVAASEAYSVTEGVPELVNGAWTRSWLINIRPAHELKNMVANMRYEKERTPVIYNGKPYLTDDVSQTKYLAVLLAAIQDPSFTVEWKTGDGSFEALNAQNILELTTVVRNHVQNCFSREAELQFYIDEANNDPDRLAAIDYFDGWPV